MRQSIFLLMLVPVFCLGMEEKDVSSESKINELRKRRDENPLEKRIIDQLKQNIAQVGGKEKKSSFETSDLPVDPFEYSYDSPPPKLVKQHEQEKKPSFRTIDCSDDPFEYSY